MTTVHHWQRRSPRASLAALLVAVVAFVTPFGKLTAFLIPARRQAHSYVAVPGTRHPPKAVAKLHGWTDLAARGGAEAETSAGSASADEEEDDDYEFNPAEVIGELKPGQEFQGVVTRVLDFGAFVDIGHDKEGLVPRSKLQDGFTENTQDVVKEGQGVTVWAEGAAAGAGRSRGPDLSAFQDVPDTEWLPGTVRGLANFGAFVEVRPSSGGASAQGLVHISQIKEGFIEDPAEELEVDQEVKVRVLSVDAAGGKMSLSMREVAS